MSTFDRITRDFAALLAKYPLDDGDEIAAWENLAGLSTALEDVLARLIAEHGNPRRAIYSLRDRICIHEHAMAERGLTRKRIKEDKDRVRLEELAGHVVRRIYPAAPGDDVNLHIALSIAEAIDGASAESVRGIVEKTLADIEWLEDRDITKIVAALRGFDPSCIYI